jgi:YVTN family beta-propeller protein
MIMKTSLWWKKSQFIIWLSLALLILPGPASQPVLAQTGPPLLFIENVGQFPAPPDGDALRFQVSGGQASLSLTDQALWLTVADDSTGDPLAGVIEPSGGGQAGAQSTDPAQRGVSVKLAFLEANPETHLEPFNRQDAHISFFMGNDSALWRSDVPVWGGVRYVDLYPGIDLIVTGEKGQLVQQWVIKEAVTTADTAWPAAIRWQIEGAAAASLENGDHLRLDTASGEVSLTLPQTVDSAGAPLDLGLTPDIDGLEITNPFTATEPEPDSSSDRPVQIADISNLLFSTYLGGSGSEDALGIGVDGAGGVYVTGRTGSINFPITPGAFDPELNGIYETYVAKLNASGATLEYATYLGGSDNEFPYDLAVDEAGQVYVTGVTSSTDFPVTPGAYDKTLGGALDGFVVKLGPSGSLAFSTYLGGSDWDEAYSIALDQAGSAYVTGMTTGTDFPTTPDAFQPASGGGSNDVFAAKLNPDGSALAYSTYLGGSDTDRASGIAVDAEGNAYLAGKTYSSDFPVTPGAFQTSYRQTFVAKLNPTGSELVYSTFLGGNGAGGAWGIAVDESGHAYVTGETTSSTFPTTPGAYQTTYHTGSIVTRDGDAYVVKFNPAGSGLVYGTFIGSFDHDIGFDLALDPFGQVYVTGVTYAVDFPTTAGAIQSTPPGYPDAFVAKLNAAGSDLIYSTYLGSRFGDVGYAITADASGNAYVTGFANWYDFPTTGDAFSPSFNGGQDAFVSKLATGDEPEEPPSLPSVPSHTCAPTSLGAITVGNEPRGIVVDSDRQRVYVANYSSDSVSVIDSSSNTVIDTITGLTYANDITHDPTHNVLWVTNQSTDQVTPIQANLFATGFTTLPAISVGDSPWGVTYDPVHDYVYVVNSHSNSVTVIHAATRTVVTTLTGSFHLPIHIAANPVTGKVYVVNFGGPSVVVLDGTTISKVIDLYDSKEPYGLAIDETRNLVYVATVEPHRIVVIGPANGQTDRFLGWGAFHRGFGNPNRPAPLRAIAINPGLGPAGDGGHLWATTTVGDGSEANQALLIPKGWGGYFHFPLAQDVELYPADGLAIDRATNRVYIASGFAPGIVTVMGDHADLCPDAFSKVASLEEESNPSTELADSDQIGVEIQENTATDTPITGDLNGDGRVTILDLTYVAARFGSSAPTADLNGDGRVDILDVVIIADHYGSVDQAEPLGR